MVAAEVAEYLRNHPEFFEEQADLLSTIFLPNPHGGRAISLTERQLVALREQKAQLEDELAELMEIGHANDAISEKLHHFALALFTPVGLESFLDVVHRNLQEIFAIPHAALRIWSGQPDEPGIAEFSEVSFDVCALADELANPRCGEPVGEEILSWFGDNARHLQSFALVPLRAEESLGLLVLASEDPERFYTGMGTVYLNRLGQLLSAGLLAHLGEGHVAT